MRHEVPLEIIDPFLFVERDGQALVLTNALEHARLAEARPDAHVTRVDDLGLHDLVEDGMARHDADLEVLVRALREWDVGAARRLRHDGEELISEMVRDAVRAVCAARGAPAPPDIMVVSALSGGGHDPGSGPLPADLPITVDLWPRDEASGCWADMTRTFVHGEVGADVTAIAGVVREALEAARAAARPGITGDALYEVAAEVIEDARDRAGRRRPRGHRRRPLRGSPAHHGGRERDADPLSVRPLTRRHAGAPSSS
jgi:peptidase M24-like protein